MAVVVEVDSVVEIEVVVALDKEAVEASAEEASVVEVSEVETEVVVDSEAEEVTEHPFSMNQSL